MEEKNIATLVPETEKKEKSVMPIHAFSGAAFPKTEVQKVQEPVSAQVQQQSFPSVVEKPNYDFMETLTPEEEKVVYHIGKETSAKKPTSFGKRLRVALFSLVLMVGSVWGLVNVVTITNLQADISIASELYQLNLANYLAKLGTLDSASSYDELFETYPVEPEIPTQIAKSSNWFDRLCNFIAGLFGG